MSTPKKGDTFETIKKYVVKDTLGQSCLLQVFPPNTSFYRADEACPRLEGLQKNLSGLSAEMGSGPQATD